MKDLEQRVRELMALGKKIEAIREVREATGLGLADATAAVEKWESGGTLPAPAAPVPADLPLDVTDLARQGKTIEAIQLLRAQRPMGLREAKLLVDQVSLAPGVKRSGCAGAVLVALGGAWLLA
jgi:ribosomal protein L7/L12